MTIPKKAIEGLSMWVLMFGQEYVSFGELDDADMLQFFILSEYADDEYLQQGFAPTQTTYRLTDKALQAIREAV
tara:strand:+ start:3544 stop:3765 length:222 start_codon:yes stop_codon:yes gene_type:complete